MRKLWLTLVLALILAGGGLMGSYGLSPRPALAQPPYQYCSPYDYCDYYTAPYDDPASRFLYYAVPLIREGIELKREEEWRKHYYQQRQYERPYRRGYDYYRR